MVLGSSLPRCPCPAQPLPTRHPKSRQQKPSTEWWWRQARDRGLCWGFVHQPVGRPAGAAPVCPGFAMRGALGTPWPRRPTLALLPLQYGMLLYQNYRVPQQRKAVLSAFSAPVVSKLSLGSRAVSARGRRGLWASCLRRGCPRAAAQPACAFWRSQALSPPCLPSRVPSGSSPLCLPSPHPHTSPQGSCSRWSVYGFYSRAQKPDSCAQEPPLPPVLCPLQPWHPWCW